MDIQNADDIMAHTIEEMQIARRNLCNYIASKLDEFENEFNVKIGYVGYRSDCVYGEMSDDPVHTVGKFEIEIVL